MVFVDGYSSSLVVLVFGICFVPIIAGGAYAVNKDEPYEHHEFETFLELPPIDSNGRNAITLAMLLWPHGIIPYELSRNLTDTEKDTIVTAISVFENNTCVKLVPKEKKNVDWLRFDKGTGCGTNVGFWKGTTSPHKLVLNNDCLQLPVAIQHETMHVMGLFHEQCRYDRDQHIEVLWKNIPQAQQRNFIKVPKLLADSYGIPYDYESLMHYKGNAFARKGSKGSMRAKKAKDANGKEIKLGYVGGPTAGDFLKINRMYHCSDFL